MLPNQSRLPFFLIWNIAVEERQMDRQNDEKKEKKRG